MFKDESGAENRAAPYNYAHDRRRRRELGTELR